jgi:hypothetical protein
MPDPLPPSEAEQAARDVIASRPHRADVPKKTAVSLATECARLRAALGEVCGAAEALSAALPDGGAVSFDGAPTTGGAILDLRAAIARARSTP